MASEGEDQAPLLHQGPIVVHPSLQRFLAQNPPPRQATDFRFLLTGYESLSATYDKLYKPQASIFTRPGQIDWSGDGV